MAANSQIVLYKPLVSLTSPVFVTRELVSYFREVIAQICDCPAKLLDDCAIICAFLQSIDCWKQYYQAVVDPLLKASYLQEKEKKTASFRGGALMRAFYNLMHREGFNTLKGVVFTGPAGGFLEVISSGILFKDMTGPMHGEFTHSLQWLSVCVLKQNGCPIVGDYKLQNPIANIYSQIAKIPIYRILNGARVLTSPWPGELSFKTQNEANNGGAKTLWDFMVDGFATHTPQNAPMAKAIEDPLTTLYTSSFRCPANLLVAIQFGSLRQCFIGQWWAARIQKYIGIAGPKWYHDKKYRRMAVTQQKSKGRHENRLNTYDVRFPGPRYADPNAQGPFDAWDDEIADYDDDDY